MNKIKDKAEFIRVILVYVLILLITIGISKVIKVTGVRLSLLVSSVILYVPMVAITLIYTFIKKEKVADAFGFKKIKVSTVFLAILLTIVAMPMSTLANLISQLFVPNILAQGMDTFMEESAVLVLLAAAVIAPICEEIVMRGFMQNRLAKLIPFVASAILSGFLFGVLHMNLNQFCYAWVLGVVFAFVNRASGSIFTSMIMHLVYNIVGMGASIFAYTVAKANNMDIAQTAEATRANTSGMYVSIAICAVLAGISFILVRLIIRKIAKIEGNELQPVEGTMAE